MRSEPFVERLVLNFLNSIWVDSAPIRDLISLNSAKYRNKEVKILQRSMTRRHISYYDLIVMTEEVGFHAVDFLYYEKKDPQGKAYLVHIDDQSVAIKMFSDPDIGKTVHLYVYKEKASDDIAPPHNRNDYFPSNYCEESAQLQDGGVYVEAAEQLIVRRPQSMSLPPET